MSKQWIKAKRAEFARDVLRDFCLAARELEIITQPFARTGQVSFEALLDLLGEPMNKGLLWRLKDTSHHLFRNESSPAMVGPLLDWAMGYIFHETMKLKEDAYQEQTYAPWFRELQGQELGPRERRHTQELMQVLFQTRESMEREIRRIRFIFQQCREMWGEYLTQHRDNPLLARFLVSQNELVRLVFREEYDKLVLTIYKDQPERMYVLATRSLRQGGWLDEALKAMDKALEINPDSALVREEANVLASLEPHDSQRRTRL